MSDIAIAELRADEKDLRHRLDQLAAMSIRQQTEAPRQGLRVVEGGRAQLIAKIEFVARELRELERELASAREDLRRLLASLGPI